MTTACCPGRPCPSWSAAAASSWTTPGTSTRGSSRGTTAAARRQVRLYNKVSIKGSYTVKVSTTFSQYFEKCPTVTVLCCRVLRTGAQPLPALLQLRAGQRARGLAGGVLGAVPRGRLLQHLQLHGGHRHQQPQLPAVRAAQGRALRVGGPGVRTQLGGLQVHYHVTLCNVMSHHVTLCSLAPGQGSSCSSVAGPGPGPPAQQCHRVERQGAVFYTSVVRCGTNIYISTYLHIYTSVAGTRGLQPTCSTAAACVTRPPTADPSPTSG